MLYAWCICRHAPIHIDLFPSLVWPLFARSRKSIIGFILFADVRIENGQWSASEINLMCFSMASFVRLTLIKGTLRDPLYEYVYIFRIRSIVCKKKRISYIGSVMVLVLRSKLGWQETDE